MRDFFNPFIYHVFLSELSDRKLEEDLPDYFLQVFFFLRLLLVLIIFRTYLSPYSQSQNRKRSLGKFPSGSALAADVRQQCFTDHGHGQTILETPEFLYNYVQLALTSQQ